jgi:hypothetical protein
VAGLSAASLATRKLRGDLAAFSLAGAPKHETARRIEAGPHTIRRFDKTVNGIIAQN